MKTKAIGSTLIAGDVRRFAPPFMFVRELLSNDAVAHANSKNVVSCREILEAAVSLTLLSLSTRTAPNNTYRQAFRMTSSASFTRSLTISHRGDSGKEHIRSTAPKCSPAAIT